MIVLDTRLDSISSNFSANVSYNGNILVINFCFDVFMLNSRVGMKMLCGVIFFKWCYEDIINERDVIILKQIREIQNLENSLKVSRKWLLVLVGMICVGLINIVLWSLMFNNLWLVIAMVCL